MILAVDRAVKPQHKQTKFKDEKAHQAPLQFDMDLSNLQG